MGVMLMLRFIGKKVLWAIICVLAVTIIIFTLLYFSGNDPAAVELAKPVIYLYPENETDIVVRIDLDGQLGFTYPAYDEGWYVTAYPDGKLINNADGREYSYLFWDGVGSIVFDMSIGFIVAGSDTVTFLQNKLEYIGLQPGEYNEFIVFWAPMMELNAYNLITFQESAYTDVARLEIFPTPDSMLRVFMTYMPLDKPMTVPEQVLKPFERTGFSVVEWGGAVVTR